MRVLLAVLVLVAGVAVSGAAGSAASNDTVLTITYWPDEQASAELERWTLRCDPPGGTLPRRPVACRRLASMTRAAFAPVPRDAICTQIYGGPQKAVVKGRLRGQRIWSSFRRRNGCDIERWQRFTPWLIPPGGVTR